MKVVIPSKKNRKKTRFYDKDLYQVRYLCGEGMFPSKKMEGGIATRYAKNTALFLAAIHIGCIAIWAEIS